MKINKVLFGIAEAIVFAVYNLIVFTCSPNMTSTFWTAYLFTVLSFVLLAGNYILPLHGNSNKEQFYSLPLLIVSITYWIVQMLVGGIFILLSSVSVKFAVILEVILLALYLIVALFLLLGKRNIQNLDTETKDKILFMQLLSNDVAAMIDKATDAAIRLRLEELQDMVRSSDPLSHTSLALVDQKISNEIADLSDLVAYGDAVKIENMIDKIEQMLAERNRKCKILK